MLKKVIILFSFFTLWCLHLGAQNDYRKAYDDFTKAAKKTHSEFTDTANVIFAKTIGSEWVQYDLSDGNKRQSSPEPKVLPVADGTQAVFRVLTVSEAIDTIPAYWPLETDSSLWTPEQTANRHNSRIVRFDFYDNTQLVSIPKEYGTFHPKGISEQEVADFWEELSRYDYKLILADCAKSIELYGYNDWAVLEWVQFLSEAIFPRNIYSEKTIFSVFILNQMGLMTKIARADKQLVSLFSSMQPVYARKFVIIDTYPFYLAEKTISASQVFTYSASFMKPARPLDLRINEPLSLGKSLSYTIIRKQSSFLNMSFDLPINRALLRFYNNYPQTVVSVYASAVADKRFTSSLKTSLESSVWGMNDEEKINTFLAFLQTDFKYKTDLEQFGYEKPFFCEENFTYDYNDCEDRSALFIHLVKEFTSCKTVLLEYPDHVSAGVTLPKEFKGDHVRINGENYYTCDPSFIGATIGMTIPKYKNTAVKVYAL